MGNESIQQTATATAKTVKTPEQRIVELTNITRNQLGPGHKWNSTQDRGGNPLPPGATGGKMVTYTIKEGMSGIKDEFGKELSRRALIEKCLDEAREYKLYMSLQTGNEIIRFTNFASNGSGLVAAIDELVTIPAAAKPVAFSFSTSNATTPTNNVSAEKLFG